MKKEANNSTWEVSEEAAILHQTALVCDLTLPWSPGYENQHKTLTRYPMSGIDFVSLTIGHDGMGLSATLHHLADVKARIRSQSEKYVFVNSVADILRAKTEGKLAIGFHFQGSEGLEGDANLVEVFYQLGVRHMLLSYNQKNRACDGCHERTNSGLSRFGIKLIKEMERVGMILDLSHTGYKSTMEAMDISRAPVIFSHSNAYALVKHPRNIRDDQIKACGQTGGIIGINGLGIFLGDGKPSVENFVRHIEYVANIVGTDHVCIGLDLVYFPEQMARHYQANPEMYPEGYAPGPGTWETLAPESMPKLTEMLLIRGFSETDIKKILGQNFLRIAEQIWN